MFSWPPAMTISASPPRMAWAPRMTALRPEPQTLFRVMAGTVCGRPASSTLCRAGFCPLPAVSTWPRITSSTCSPSMPVRASSSRVTVAPSCGAGIRLNEPWKLPMAVRQAATITTSRITFPRRCPAHAWVARPTTGIKKRGAEAAAQHAQQLLNLFLVLRVGADAQLTMRIFSELLGGQAIQRLATGTDARFQAQGAWQQAGEEELGGGQLAAVEGFVLALLAQRHGGHARRHVGVGDVTEQMQVLHRGCADGIRLVPGLFQQPAADGFQSLQRLEQQGAVGGFVVMGEGAHLGGEQAQRGAAVGHHLAPEQVER